MLSRILRCMNISKWFRRRKPTDDELREEEESRVRAAEEVRRAEQDSERSRQQSRVPSNPFTGGGGGFYLGEEHGPAAAHEVGRGACEGDEEDERHGELEHVLQTRQEAQIFPTDFLQPCGCCELCGSLRAFSRKFRKPGLAFPTTDGLGSARRSQEPPLPVVGP